MELKTARLTIRPPRRGDGERIAAYYTRNRAFLQPWYPRFRPEDTDAAAWERAIPLIDAERRDKKALRTILLDTAGTVVGVANLTSITGSPGFRSTLGYSLAERVEGQGLMREALSALLPVAVERFRLHRVEAAYLPRNARSGRLLESLGFEREGLAREYLLIDGVWEDHVLTAWMRHDWR